MFIFFILYSLIYYNILSLHPGLFAQPDLCSDLK